MSGLPQTADIPGPGRHFAFVPIADIAQVDNAVGSLRRPLFSLLATAYARQRPRIGINTMTRWISALSLLSLVLFWTNQGQIPSRPPASPRAPRLPPCRARSRSHLGRLGLRLRRCGVKIQLREQTKGFPGSAGRAVFLPVESI